MTSPTDPHASVNTHSDVHVIDINTDTDIDDDIKNVILNVIEKSEVTVPVKIEIDLVPSRETQLKGTLTFPKSKPHTIAEVVQKARDAFNRGVTRPIEWRRKQLKSLLRMYEEKSDAMIEALRKDLGKSKFEAVLVELDILTNDLKNTLHNLDDWCKPKWPGKTILNILDDVLIYNDPYGVALIISAWNYPLQLLLLPVSGAIAAGNVVIMKPSEVAEACKNFLVENIPKYLDPEAIMVVEGGPQETTDLLKQKLDYIFYTGSTQVGRIVYEAATKNLTPVTLELGGKSPVYIDNTVDITVTAKRILWGKFINAGQTCIAPDYILCSKEVQDKFVEASKKLLNEWYGGNPQKSPDLCRIINSRHFDRLQTLVHENKDKIVIGGAYDSNDRFIEPTLIANVSSTDRIMEDEIFGPILPIVPIENAYEAVKLINDREKPLVLYIFTNSHAVVSRFVENTSSGGMCINDTVLHSGVDTLPFGGVGNSGIGAYHGKATFDTFTHKKSCLKKNLAAIGEKMVSSRYPPYTDRNLNLLRFLTRKRKTLSLKFLPYILAFVIGAGISYGICAWQKVRNEDA